MKNERGARDGRHGLARDPASRAKAGVKYYFIEDESPTSVRQIPLSLRFWNA